MDKVVSVNSVENPKRNTSKNSLRITNGDCLQTAISTNAHADDYHWVPVRVVDDGHGILEKEKQTANRA